MKPRFIDYVTRISDQKHVTPERKEQYDKLIAELKDLSKDLVILYPTASASWPNT